MIATRPPTMLNRLAVASSLVFALLAGCVRSPATGPTAAVSPSDVRATLEDLQYFVGDWNASVEDPRSGTRATLSYRVEPTLRGAWLAGRGHSPELDLTVHDMWGRDAVSGEIVRTIFDSQGIHGLVRSSGWTGDVLTLQGEARTPQGIVHVRETITRIDAATFRAVWEMRVDDAWVTYSVEQVTRVDAPNR